jgi:hypothetical protein
MKRSRPVQVAVFLDAGQGQSTLKTFLPESPRLLASSSPARTLGLILISSAHPDTAASGKFRAQMADLSPSTVIPIIPAHSATVNGCVRSISVHSPSPVAFRLSECAFDFANLPGVLPWRGGGAGTRVHRSRCD